ncbi:hypothetical protein E4T56_gene4184, partial [Termitomyces sp. T112]
RLGIALRDGQRSRGSIDAHPVGSCPFIPHREQRRPRPRPAINHPRRYPAGLKRGFHDGVTVAARDQRGGSDAKGQAPEFLMPGDMGHRLMPRAARNQGGENFRHGIAHMAQQQIGARTLQGMGHQHFGIQPRRIAGGAQAFGCRADRQGDRHTCNRGHQFAKPRPFEDFGQAVERQVDPVIGDAALREIIGADAFGAVAAAHHGLAGLSLGALCLVTHLFIEARAQHLHRLGAVLVLGSLVLTDHDKAGGQMGDAHRRIGGVHMLSARPGRAGRAFDEFAFIDADRAGDRNARHPGSIGKRGACVQHWAHGGPAMA